MSEELAFHDTTMRHVMTPHPHTVDRDTPLAEASALMRRHHVRHLPVLHRGALVGLLSERDVRTEQPLAAAMHTAVFTTTPDARLRDVARVMAAERYGCAVVLDDGRVCGIFTSTDALRYLVAKL